VDKNLSPFSIEAMTLSFAGPPGRFLPETHFDRLISSYTSSSISSEKL